MEKAALEDSETQRYVNYVTNDNQLKKQATYPKGDNT
jgi:hypothetical protein